MTGEMGFEFYSEVKLLKSYFGTNCAVIVAERGENKGRNFCNMTDEEGDCSLSLSANYFCVVHPSSYPSILPFPSPLSFQSSLFIRYRAYTGARARGQLSVYRTCGRPPPPPRAASLICLSLTASPFVRPSVRPSIHPSASYMGNEKALHVLAPSLLWIPPSLPPAVRQRGSQSRRGGSETLCKRKHLARAAVWSRLSITPEKGLMEKELDGSEADRANCSPILAADAEMQRRESLLHSRASSPEENIFPECSEKSIFLLSLLFSSSSSSSSSPSSPLSPSALLLRPRSGSINHIVLQLLTQMNRLVMT